MILVSNNSSVRDNYDLKYIILSKIDAGAQGRNDAGY